MSRSLVAETASFVVAKDGSGQYRTVHTTIDVAARSGASGQKEPPPFLVHRRTVPLYCRAVPHSLGGVFRSPRGASNSKSMNSNHDNSCRHDPLGQDASQHVPNENAKPNPIDNTAATGLEGSHVSPTACSSAKIFMAEGTGNLQRSKKSDHTNTSSVALTL
ncbi:hypothetical protein Ancab_010231 [Ancistrocladus abbreviatus]